MPRSTAPALRAAGWEAVDVRDVGLRGRSDDEVFQEAQRRGAVLVTEDMGFANVLSFPLGSHAGIVVLRVPNELPARLVSQELIRALADESLTGALLIVEVGRSRLRRPTANRAGRGDEGWWRTACMQMGARAG